MKRSQAVLGVLAFLSASCLTTHDPSGLSVPDQVRLQALHEVISTASSDPVCLGLGTRDPSRELLAAASKLRAVHAASQCLANALRVVFGVIELTTALDRANISVRTQQGESTATVHELHFRKDGAVWRSERPTAVHD